MCIIFRDRENNASETCQKGIHAPLSFCVSFGLRGEQLCCASFASGALGGLFGRGCALPGVRFLNLVAATLLLLATVKDAHESRCAASNEFPEAHSTDVDGHVGVPPDCPYLIWKE